MMSLMTFNNVWYSSDDKDIIKNLSFDLEKGDFMSIVGPSGGGKSTLLKLANSLISPSKGDIFFKGDSLEKLDPISLRQKVSYVFQTPHLFGETVEDNIAFPYNIRQLPVDKERVNVLFDLFQMDKDYLKQDVKKLSGGEKQRIALIRQLLFEPEILLLDEVTSALDQKNKEIVETVIQDCHQKGVTIMWVTHDMEQSQKYANRLMTIVAGQLESLEVLK